MAFAGQTLDEAIAANSKLLQEIVSYHILPPVPYLLALWTTPFFLPDTILATVLPQENVVVGPGQVLQAAGGNMALIVKPDIDSCKVGCMCNDGLWGTAAVKFGFKNKSFIGQSVNCTKI